MNLAGIEDWRTSRRPRTTLAAQRTRSMSEPTWHNLGAVAELSKRPLQQIHAGSLDIALSYADGKFGAP